MRIQSRLLVLPLLISCAKPVATTGASTPASPHPDLHCPPGSIPAGKAPPLGLEVWCHAQGQPGKWLREGPSISWHDNQQRASEGLFSHGKPTGPWQYWYPTGQPMEQGSFAGGVKDGVWVTYHADGTRSAEGTMVDGKHHGEWSYWSSDGQSRTVGQWKLGKKDGIWNEMNAEDRAVAERLYRDGRLVSQKDL
jgi:hypothetical protein